CVPLVRLPEGEEIEQWYPLVPKETGLSLRTALRVALCFNPSGKTRGRGDSFSMQLRRIPAQLSMTAATEISSASPVGPSRLRVQIPPPPIQSPVNIALKSGVVDYVIVVGPSNGHGGSECHENSLLLRYPAIDRPHFPLPTKIEWFCFPGGPEEVIQADRPQSKLFSFVLVGGDDGLCRSVPLIEELKGCLLGVAHAWLSAQASVEDVEKFTAEECIADLCNRVLIPIRGVFGVRFSIQQLPISLVLPAHMSIYSNHSRPSSTKRPSQPGQFSPTKSPSTNFINIQQGFQPLVYSLAPIFQLFDVKTIIHLVSLVLCEYRILIHSTQFSLLCPFAEGLCALIYPFRWQHPYVPILPRVLSEYLQAPLPYILGVHTSWLPELLENGRPEHLVIVDIDRGAIQLQESTGPMLPSKLTKGLHQRIRKIIHPRLFDDISGDDMIAVQSKIPADASAHDVIKWDSQIEQQVRVEFVCFLAAMLMGYRDCLFFVNQKLPVFNKRRYFSTCANDNEVVPFVSKLFCTQAFQGFLENHSSAELSVFHSIYLTFSRGKDMDWPSSMPPMSISNHAAASSANSASFGQGARAKTGVITPVYTMPSSKGSQNCVIAPNSQDAMEESEMSNTLKKDNVASVGEKVEALLDKLSSSMTDPFALDPAEFESYSSRSPNHVCDYKQVAEDIGVDPRILEDNSDLFQNPHQVNQNQGMHGAGSTSHNGMVGGSNVRNLSTEEERIEQVLHKCLTSVFASDDMITPEDIRMCEVRFKNQYARDLFVLILMQPSHQYVEMNSASTNGVANAGGSTWYNPKGSGNCIGESGFQILARLSSTLMDQCAIHEDFTNARGMLQVAFQYYHFVEDKHSGVGFAKKEYLVTPLRLRPICRSLDMWQHAFSREIDAAIQADPTISDEANPNSVADEVFFSIIGSLVYDMLTMEVPLPKVHTFVSVMCSTYQKGKDLLDTLKQLVENVHRALEMSKDVIKAPAEKVPVTVWPAA
uniref:UDENN domain-containing protein n=1 Tax=Globisporangium ultimum (strain ATCC 200006 / CBS 805.95 / DAOM BR144) TaxID=431595 RepID=K3WH00_GLOUD